VANIEYYADKMTTDLGKNIDADLVAQDIYGILRLESNLGKDKPSENTQLISKIGRTVLGENADKGSISTGAAKIKLNSLSYKEQKFLGIKSVNDLNSMKNSVKAATYMYIKNHGEFSRYAEANPQLKLTPNDVRLLTILAHNEGPSRLKKFGYNNENKYFSESLKALRDLQKGKIKDVSSTKLAHLNKLIPGLGDLAYDIKLKFAGETYGKDPYIKRVLYHGAKLPEVQALVKGGMSLEAAKEKVRKDFYKKKIKEDADWQTEEHFKDDDNVEKFNKKYGIKEGLKS
jgi:hypothetical protein